MDATIDHLCLFGVCCAGSAAGAGSAAVGGKATVGAAAGGSAEAAASATSELVGAEVGAEGLWQHMITPEEPS
jgi:hypothetical protein